MKTYSKECFWSRLDITIQQSDSIDSAIAESLELIDNFEQKYSRFIDGNTLSHINKEKKWELPDEIMTLIWLAIKVSTMTKGHFDITILPLLENNGYGIEKERMNTSLWYENIECSGNTITLNNDISIEFWALGKWYAIDLIYNTLITHSSDFIINFGWDIRVAGNTTIQLEDPMDTNKSIWSIALENLAIASSAGNRRKLNVWHHLINPKSKESAEDKIAVYVTHKLWVFADIFATALFVCPLKDSLEILEKTPWLEALIIGADGKIYKSQWFNSILKI